MAGDPRTGFEVKVEGRVVAALYDGPDWYPNGVSTTMLSDILALLQVTTPTKLNYRFVGWKYGNQILDLQTATMADVISFGGGSISAEFVVDESESSDPLDVSSYEGGNMLNSNIFRTRDVRWESANLDMREGKAFGHRPSLEKGPCKHGFHVPTAEEREEVSDVIEELDLSEKIHEALLLPKAGKKTGLNTDVDVGDEGYYLTRIPNANGTANVFHPSAEGSEMLQMAIKNAISVRGFRNSPITPTTGWTRLPASGGPRLPLEYQEVEYIESTGTQWIDSGYIPKSTSGFEMKFRNISAINTYRTLIGTRTDTSTAAFWIGWMNGKCYMEMSPANIEYTRSDGWFNTGIDYEMSFLNKTLICNGETFQSGTNFTQNSARNLYIFSGNANGQTQPFEAAASRMYYLKLYEGETLVRDFVPCYRRIDGVIGMYDLVNDQFYANAGTGTFAKGLDVETPSLPSQYQEVAYIESSGTQWLDTNHIPTSNTKVQFGFTPIGWTGWTALGYYTGNDNTDWRFFTSYGSTSAIYTDHPGRPVFDFNSGRIEGSDNTFVLNTKYDLEMGNYYLKYLYGSNIVSGTTISGFTGTTTIKLDWSYSVATNASNRWHYVIIYEDGELVKYLIPCYRKSDSKPGMYDVINDVFYTNSGTGEYAIGHSVFYRVNGDTIAYYPLDGNLNDWSPLLQNSNGNSNITYETLSSNRKVARLTSDNAGISIPGGVANSLTGDFTISMWLYVTGQGQSNTALVFGVWYDTSPFPGPNIWRGYNGNGKIVFRLNSDTTMSSSTGTDTLQNRRIHICWTRISGVNVGYINGVEECRMTSTIGTSSGNAGFILSRYSSSQSLANGSMGSDIFIEKRGRSPEEITSYINKARAEYGL